MDDKIQSFMEVIDGDWIKWHKKPPFANHMGGVWERQIRSVLQFLHYVEDTWKKPGQ